MQLVTEFFPAILFSLLDFEKYIIAKVFELIKPNMFNNELDTLLS